MRDRRHFLAGLMLIPAAIALPKLQEPLPSVTGSIIHDSTFQINGNLIVTDTIFHHNRMTTDARR